MDATYWTREIVSNGFLYKDQLIYRGTGIKSHIRYGLGLPNVFTEWRSILFSDPANTQEWFQVTEKDFQPNV